MSTNNPNQKLGRVTIKVDGDVIESYPDATIDPGSFEVTPKENGNYPGHWSEGLTAGNVKCKIDWGVGDSIDTIKGWRDVTLVCECDTGQTFVGSHFTVTKVPPIGKDTIELEFHGPQMEPMTIG